MQSYKITIELGMDYNVTTTLKIPKPWFTYFDIKTWFNKDVSYVQKNSESNVRYYTKDYDFVVEPKDDLKILIPELKTLIPGSKEFRYLSNVIYNVDTQKFTGTIHMGTSIWEPLNWDLQNIEEYKKELDKRFSQSGWNYSRSKYNAL